MSLAIAVIGGSLSPPTLPPATRVSVPAPASVVEPAFGQARRVIGRVNLTTRLLVRISVGGQTLRTTLDHAFYIRRHGWVSARDLKTGMVLEGAREVESASLISEVLPESVPTTPVFNLLVEGDHTFHVGAPAALVHNGQCVQLPATGAQRFSGQRLLLPQNAPRAARRAHLVPTHAGWAAPELPPNVLAIETTGPKAARGDLATAERYKDQYDLVITGHGFPGGFGRFQSYVKMRKEERAARRPRWRRIFDLRNSLDERHDAGQAAHGPQHEGAPPPWYRAMPMEDVIERSQTGFRSLDKIGRAPIIEHIEDAQALSKGRRGSPDASAAFAQNQELRRARGYDIDAAPFSFRALARFMSQSGFPSRANTAPVGHLQHPTPVDVRKPDASCPSILLATCYGASDENDQIARSTAQLLANRTGYPVTSPPGSLYVASEDVDVLHAVGAPRGQGWIRTAPQRARPER